MEILDAKSTELASKEAEIALLKEKLAQATEAMKKAGVVDVVQKHAIRRAEHILAFEEDEGREL